MAPRPIGGGGTAVLNSVKLPQSSTRLQKGFAHCRVLTRVDMEAGFSLGFEGSIYPPGAAADRGELPERLVVLECAGPIGSMVERRREMVWILWRYDDPRREWREIARASAVGWEWAVSLRQPAHEALRVDRGLYDVLELGRATAAEIAETIVRRIEDQPAAVRVHILSSVYDRIAGEIARASR